MTDVLLENINRMLDVSRIAVGDTRLLYEKISISELIEEIIGEIEEDIIEKGHELIVNMDDLSQDNVYTDKMRLKQAIKNIVLNAVQYTYKNGIIKVTVIEGPSEIIMQLYVLSPQSRHGPKQHTKEKSSNNLFHE